jgi:hypothetical protein
MNQELLDRSLRVGGWMIFIGLMLACIMAVQPHVTRNTHRRGAGLVVAGIGSIVVSVVFLMRLFAIMTVH